MEKRKPMQIDRIIIAYNFVQIIINAALVVTVGSFVEWNGLIFLCQNDEFNFIFTHIRR